ncbi:MAG: RAD55 family ATPase [Candidatus Bathyarchaeia archaeon]
MRLALIEDLLTEPLPAGSNLLVVYDATSQWYRVSLNIAREWLRAGGDVGYNVAAQRPDNIRSQLEKLGLSVKELEAGGKLEIWDWYSATLGQKPKDALVGASSLKAADLSISIAQDELKPAMAGEAYPEYLRIWDNSSVLARFNEDKAWVEFLLTRIFPSGSYTKSTLLVGLIRGVHSEWVYGQLEDAADGVIDCKLEEIGEETSDVLRIRSMRNVGYDRKWHRLNIGENLEVTIEK